MTKIEDQPRSRMTMTMQILDPTNEKAPIRRELSDRPDVISGRVALLDISKRQGDVFIDRLEAVLSERLPGVDFRRYRKDTFARPAPDELRRRIAEDCGFVIEALAD